MLQEIGLNVELDVLDWETQLANYRKGDFQRSSFGYGGRDHPLLAYGLFTGSKDILKLKQWNSDQAEGLVLACLDAKGEGDLQERSDQLYEAFPCTASISISTRRRSKRNPL